MIRISRRGSNKARMRATAACPPPTRSRMTSAPSSEGTRSGNSHTPTSMSFEASSMQRMALGEGAGRPGLGARKDTRGGES